MFDRAKDNEMTLNILRKCREVIHEEVAHIKIPKDSNRV